MFLGVDGRVASATITGRKRSPYIYYRGPRDDTMSSDPITRSTLQTLTLPRTLQHQSVEAYRQAGHATVSALRDLQPDQTDSTLHGGIDDHCDEIHDVIADGWAVYDHVLQDTADATSDLVADYQQLVEDTMSLATWQPQSEPSSSASGSRADEPTDVLQSITGVGPTYAARLREEGIETLEDLAAAETDIAGAIDARVDQLEDWRDQAAARVNDR